jgi:hypothetical protein
MSGNSRAEQVGGAFTHQVRTDRSRSPGDPTRFPWRSHLARRATESMGRFRYIVDLNSGDIVDKTAR